MEKSIELSFTELADAAFRQAAVEVIRIAKQTGTPVIVWTNGAIKGLDPRTIRLPRCKSKKKIGK